MSRFWSPLVHDLVPYVPGEQPKIQNLVKLNTNENPFGPSPQVIDAIRSVLDDSLRLYPDPNAAALKQTLAEYHGVKRSQVFVGNGSDEVLAHIFQALFQHGKPLLFPDITYSFYPVYCGLYGVEPMPVPLDESFRIRPEDYSAKLQKEDGSPASKTGDNGGVILPNPNAPTGILLSLEDIQAIVNANPDSVVVIDEAYVDFGGSSAIALVADNPNLLVTQTLSKSRSLAGLRVGFAVGHEDLIEALERVKNSFNSYPLDRLAIAGAVAAYHDEAYFQRTRRQVIDERERLTGNLERLGFEVLPSAANFVFARHGQHEGARLTALLREQGIIVRHFKKPRIDQFLRITIGTAEQNDALVAALTDII